MERLLEKPLKDNVIKNQPPPPAHPKNQTSKKNTTKKLMSSPGISESFWHIIDLKTYIDILEEILAKIITIMK